MPSITKAVLAEKAEDAFDAFMDKATREDMMRLTKYLTTDHASGDSHGLAQIVIRDRTGQETVLDLVTKVVTPPLSSGVPAADGVAIEGEGDILTLDLSLLELWNGSVIHFPYNLSLNPIRLTYGEKEEEPAMAEDNPTREDLPADEPPEEEVEDALRETAINGSRQSVLQEAAEIEADAAVAAAEEDDEESEA